MMHTPLTSLFLTSDYSTEVGSSERTIDLSLPFNLHFDEFSKIYVAVQSASIPSAITNIHGNLFCNNRLRFTARIDGGANAFTSTTFTIVFEDGSYKNLRDINRQIALFFNNDKLDPDSGNHPNQAKLKHPQHLTGHRWGIDVEVSGKDTNLANDILTDVCPLIFSSDSVNQRVLIQTIDWGYGTSAPPPSLLFIESVDFTPLVVNNKSISMASLLGFDEQLYDIPTVGIINNSVVYPTSAGIFPIGSNLAGGSIIRNTIAPKLATFGDSFNYGVNILIEGDIKTYTFNNRTFDSSVVANVVTPTTLGVDKYYYPSGGQELLWCPILHTKQLNNIRIRFVSGVDREDIIFDGGECNVVLQFMAIP